jgi:GNAT superfamily N-acetyltransferase
MCNGNLMLTISPVRSESDLDQFITFPWAIYYADPYWVPPLLDDRRGKLDTVRSAFWKNASRELWVARLDGRCVGTIAAIIDQVRIKALGEAVGSFGFFESLPDPAVAGGLLDSAAQWLRQQGMELMRGPYNPSGEDECGILVDGFATRPALLEAHTPPYYPGLLEARGMVKYRDLVARLWRRQPGKSLDEQLPGKLMRTAGRAAERPDLRIRRVNMRAWADEMELAWRIYTTALSALPEFVPITLDDFRALADSFRQILDPRMVLVAEVGGKTAGFVLALPDANEALQKVLSHQEPRQLDALGMLRLFWYTRQLKRVTYKILMILPEYQGRGIEAVLSAELARTILNLGYQEVDMSMTGEENERSNRFQENLGFQVYRRYRLYQKELA